MLHRSLQVNSYSMSNFIANLGKVCQLRDERVKSLLAKPGVQKCLKNENKLDLLREAFFCILAEEELPHKYLILANNYSIEFHAIAAEEFLKAENNEIKRKIEKLFLDSSANAWRSFHMTYNQGIGIKDIRKDNDPNLDPAIFSSYLKALEKIISFLSPESISKLGYALSNAQIWAEASYFMSRENVEMPLLGYLSHAMSGQQVESLHSFCNILTEIGKIYPIFVYSILTKDLRSDAVFSETFIPYAIKKLSDELAVKYLELLAQTLQGVNKYETADRALASIRLEVTYKLLLKEVRKCKSKNIFLAAINVLKILAVQGVSLGLSNQSVDVLLDLHELIDKYHNFTKGFFGISTSEEIKFSPKLSYKIACSAHGELRHFSAPMLKHAVLAHIKVMEPKEEALKILENIKKNNQKDDFAITYYFNNQLSQRELAKLIDPIIKELKAGSKESPVQEVGFFDQLQKMLSSSNPSSKESASFEQQSSMTLTSSLSSSSSSKMSHSAYKQLFDSVVSEFFVESDSRRQEVAKRLLIRNNNNRTFLADPDVTPDIFLAYFEAINKISTLLRGSVKQFVEYFAEVSSGYAYSSGSKRGSFVASFGHKLFESTDESETSKRAVKLFQMILTDFAKFEPLAVYHLLAKTQIKSYNDLAYPALIHRAVELLPENLAVSFLNLFAQCFPRKANYSDAEQEQYKQDLYSADFSLGALFDCVKNKAGENKKIHKAALKIFEACYEDSCQFGDISVQEKFCDFLKSVAALKGGALRMFKTMELSLSPSAAYKLANECSADFYPVFSTLKQKKAVLNYIETLEINFALALLGNLKNKNEDAIPVENKSLLGFFYFNAKDDEVKALFSAVIEKMMSTIAVTSLENKTAQAFFEPSKLLDDKTIKALLNAHNDSHDNMFQL